MKYETLTFKIVDQALWAASINPFNTSPIPGLECIRMSHGDPNLILDKIEQAIEAGISGSDTIDTIETLLKNRYE